MFATRIGSWEAIPKTVQHAPSVTVFKAESKRNGRPETVTWFKRAFASELIKSRSTSK